MSTITILAASVLFAHAGLAESTETDRIPDAVVAISAGEVHTCAVTEPGMAWCWGYNGQGQLGHGTTASTSVPAMIKGLTEVVDIAAGKLHSCAITAKGEAWCWGHNAHGQLGDGSTTASLVPVRVSGLEDVMAIAVGESFSCAVTATEGKAWCWGANAAGQLGNGTTTPSLVPVEVQGLADLTTIDAAFYEAHACARDATGRGWCWGRNDHGQLGDGSTISRSTPVAVDLEEELRSVSVGMWHSCGLQRDGQPWCWGSNWSGQLGSGGPTGNDARSPTPVQVKDLGSLLTIATGKAHTCAIDSKRQAWCWGENASGGLGGGKDTHHPTPVQVNAELPKVTAITAGGAHSCAITRMGEAFCWGAGTAGQLGSATTSKKRKTPRPVKFP